MLCHETQMVKVRVIDPVLKRSYGTYMHRTMSEAIRGQQKGIWEIAQREDYDADPIYRTREMIAERHQDSYLTRTAFRKQRSTGLNPKDLWGGEKKPGG